MGILSRAKQLAEMKLADRRAKAREEKEYQNYKNPDLAFIRGAPTTTDYEKSTKFAARQKAERERTTARNAMLKTKAKGFMSGAGKYMFSEQGGKPAPRGKPRKVAAQPSMFGGGFGGMPNMGYLLQDTKKRRRK